eukprot:TRINITY_DN12277_c0_g1_i1.p1 TRINITY_DN12277_c0_g1~~TRINITY_DN12277_c0_g1_i1.p1  ORF type:complete len:422 (-),score=82.13 TRINITY_DN12277_c0_g1_i1:397-1662(-)
MKFMGGFLLFFLILIMSGTVSYMYLMWTNYWLRMKTYEMRYFNKNTHSRSSSLRKKAKLEIVTKASIPKETNNKTTATTKKKKAKINLSKLPKDKLMAHIRAYKDQILNQLKSTVSEAGRQVNSASFPNAYNVSYTGSYAKQDVHLTTRQLLCSAKKNLHIRTFSQRDQFFNKLKLAQFFPESELFHNRTFNTCAVVTSAGSMKHAKLGQFIDDHDLVLRFNNAPTDEFAKDVGHKTTIRIVNSQVVAKPHFKFLESKIFSNQVVIVWDPSAYKADLEDWYSKPDWPFFEQYFSKRLMQPEDSLYLLNPESLWSLWDWLQSLTPVPLLPTPPSSGFLGIMLLLNYCATVHAVEYVPSMRLTKRCHYYDDEENIGCTLGDWHPLSAEKLLVLKMHTGTDEQLYHRGILTIPGFQACPSPSSH